MKLQEAIVSILESKGTNIFKNVLVVNVLSDYNAFVEMPAAKNVLKNMILEGVMDKLLFAHDNNINVQNNFQSYLHELCEKYGFREDVSSYVLNSILGGIGYEIVKEKLEDKNKEDFIKTTKEINIKPGKHLTFRDVEINGTIREICAELEKLGYSEPILLDGGAVFSGDFAGVPNCTIYVVGSTYKDCVWKIRVCMPENNSWYQLKMDYERFREMLTKKYGAPKSYEFFSEPYYEGDGYEITALSVGSCTYSSYYNLPLGTICLEISEQGALVIDYEDKINSELHTQEKDNIAFGEI